jgi:hypothetical protein
VILLQWNSPESMARIAVSLVGRAPALGEMIDNHQVRLFQYSPYTMYLLFDLENAPNYAQESNVFVTDVSHGLCKLNLKGEKALEFIGDYVSASIYSPRIRGYRNVRCRIGHFTVLLWWSNKFDVHILVDRSFAQSFYDYVLALSLRWSGVNEFLNSHHSQDQTMESIHNRL